MKTFDLIIVGGGAGAFAAAIRANELGAKTVMINDGLPLGGTCVNVGCVPSKRLLRAAEVLHAARSHGIPGVELDIKRFTFSNVIKDELDLVDKLREDKYETVLGKLDHVTFIEGMAVFTDPNSVEVNGQNITAKKVLIATGSTTIPPDVPGLNDAGFLTHIEALKLQALPNNLVILGAGPVGLEFAQMFSRFGTRVTILQRNKRIFPAGEEAFTEQLTDILQKEGIRVVTGVDVKEVRKKGSTKRVIYEHEGQTLEASAEEILIATGKKPNTASLRLDTAKVKTNARGAVAVSPEFQTSHPDIYAVGDVADPPLRQETTAGREGTLAAMNALDGKRESIDYTTVPFTVFTDPQLAGVGLTEDEQMKQMGVCACRQVRFDQVPKAHILGKTEGMIKMAIHPDSKQIMGVHILAPNASELIAEAMILVKHKLTIDDVIDTIPMFPTLSEAIRFAALSFTKDLKQLSCCT